MAIRIFDGITKPKENRRRLESDRILEVFRTDENYKTNDYSGTVLVNGIFRCRTSSVNGRELAGLSRTDKAGNLK